MIVTVIEPSEAPAEASTTGPGGDPQAAARRLAAMLEPAAIDALLADADAAGTPLDGRDGLLAAMTKAVIERALDVEMAEHLGYEAGDPAGRGSGNSRNGYGRKSVITTAGQVPIEVPRDRAGTFTPAIVPKRRRRLGQVEDMILSLYARGLSTRDIRDHLAEIYGADVSAATVSRVTDVVADEIASWQSRPVDAVYPILYIDAIVIKVRDTGVVANKAAHLVVGVDVEGRKHVLGIWLQQAEGAKFWAGVLTELRNRGLRDALIVCCDGLKGLPEAIGSVWPQAVVQTCVTHLIRASMRYTSWKDRKAMTASLKPIYTAPTVEAAQLALEAFAETWGRKAPGAVAAWQRAWPDFIPFLAFPPEIRKIVYTTNLIESINSQIRRVVRDKGHFPTDDAAIKLLYLAVRNISTRRGGDLGTGTHGWTAALNAFALHFPERLPL